MKKEYANYLFSLSRLMLAVCVLICGFTGPVAAQTDIHITGAQTGFPVAVPQLCNAGGAEEFAKQIPEVIAQNLQLSGIFNVLNPATFVETPGKCVAPDGIAFSDWSVIGAEGLVRGEVAGAGANYLEIRMYLYDVLQKRAVIGKKYEASTEDFARVAHKFSNEIMAYFTGKPGVFGTEIAYVSRVGRFKELFVMDLLGTNNRQLTRDKGLVVAPSWSPSGDRIVYTSYRTRQPDLYMVSAGGGEARRITNREGLEVGPRFSPSGNEILASASFAGISKLVLFDLRGNIVRRITEGGAIDVSPSYSPDGSQIAFCSNRAGGPQIYVMSAGGGQARRVSFTESNYCTSPVWSPLGDKIAFTCLSGGNQVFVVPAQGGKALQVTYAGNNEDPEWSPDGRFLVFSSTASRRGKTITVLSLLGGAPKPIGASRSEDVQPAWSPVVR